MNKRTMKKGLAIVLALVMVFAMTATAFASTNGTATINFYIVDEATGTGELVDSVTAASKHFTTHLTISTIMSQVGRKELMSMTMYRQHTI